MKKITFISQREIKLIEKPTNHFTGMCIYSDKGSLLFVLCVYSVYCIIFIPFSLVYSVQVAVL